jgi:hypothetical protein
MRKFLFWMKDERGGIAAMTAIMLAAIVGLLALVVDLGHLQDVKNELQNAADAAALAGARALMPLSGTGDPPWPMENPPPCMTAHQAALDTSVRNQANLKDISLDPAEVITGNWDYKPVGTRTGTFTAMACGSETNAVKVTARMRGDLPQGPVTMTFAKIFGFNTVNPFATAIAAVGYLSELPKDTPGGFLAADYYFLDQARQNYEAGNEDQTYYLIIGPAGGQTTYQYADNGSWALPSDSYQSFMQSLNDYINNGTPDAIQLDSQQNVDLKNGEFTSALMNLQQAVNNAKLEAGKDGLDAAIFGVYKQTDGAPVGDAWNEKSTPINSAFWIDITNVWRPNEAKKDPTVQAFLDQMSLYDQKNIVGVIAFKITGEIVIAGPGGNTVPSNTYGYLVKLVQ